MARYRVTRVVINGRREVVITVDAPSMDEALTMIQAIKRLDAHSVVADALEEIGTKGEPE